MGRQNPADFGTVVPDFAKPSMAVCWANKRLIGDAGWSSPVARQAHNLKVVGSNPTPATNYLELVTFSLNQEDSLFG